MSYRRRRIYFTNEQKSEIWDRWQRGESMSSIGRGFDRDSSSNYPLLSRTGGIRPPARKRSRLALTLGEREIISRGVAACQSVRAIARKLCRPASTVSREIGRNGGYNKYSAVDAESQAGWNSGDTCGILQEFWGHLAGILGTPYLILPKTFR